MQRLTASNQVSCDIHRRHRSARSVGTGAAFAAALLAAPACFAAAPGTGSRGATFDTTRAGRVTAPWLHNAALADATLASIRGGFDLTPHLTINFAYRQITTINGTVVASVMIPHVHLSMGSNGPGIAGTPAVITTTPGQASISAPPSTPPTAPVTTTVSHVAFPVSSPAPVRTMVANATPSRTDPATSIDNVNGTGSQRPSQTLTTISPSAITTVVRNMQNNAVIQQTGWANIDVTGLPATVTRQAGRSMMNRNLIAASRSFR